MGLIQSQGSSPDHLVSLGQKTLKQNVLKCMSLNCLIFYTTLLILEFQLQTLHKIHRRGVIGTQSFLYRLNIYLQTKRTPALPKLLLIYSLHIQNCERQYNGSTAYTAVKRTSFWKSFHVHCTFALSVHSTLPFLNDNVSP